MISIKIDAEMNSVLFFEIADNRLLKLFWSIQIRERNL